MNKYIDEFIKFKCSGDVLNCVKPMHNPSRQISEAMAVIRLLRRAALRHPNKYKIVEMNSGNALTSILALHLLPIKSAKAYGYSDQNGMADNVKAFDYSPDACDPYNNEIDANTIIVDVNNRAHSYSKTLSIVSAHEHCKFILLPEVIARSEDEFIRRNLGVAGTNALQIRHIIGGRIYQDKRILGRKNVMIYWLDEDRV